MDETSVQRAQARRGVVTRPEVGQKARRDAPRAGLREVQRGAYLAKTQPYDIGVQLCSLTVSHPAGGWTVGGEAAVWLHGCGGFPTGLLVAIPASSELAIRPPILTRRVVPDVLRGARVIKGYPVVALEVAIIQAAKNLPRSEVLTLIEKAVRERKTTVTRLRSRLGRGLAGSAMVRSVVDELVGGSLEKDVRRLKRALERLGVTDLEVEVHFTSTEGASAYADLLHRPTMTVIEVDAALDHLERQRFLADRRRDRWMLRDHGATTLRVDVQEIRAEVTAVAAELAWFLGVEPTTAAG